ncbi:MAG TPA: hypothetical protein VKF62_08820, partial [Planctomycetota bacterium]|nr:hypothetical protein [Planctomycetota bacterium]
PDGTRISEIRRQGAIWRLLTTDLDGDGLRELVLSEGRRIAAYAAPPPDPRFRLRQAFLAALDAAERGDEERASREFEESRFRWLGFDDSRLAAIRARLVACPRSASAQGMARVLERLRPASPVEWVEGVDELVRLGRVSDALAVARERLGDSPGDDALAGALNQAAWSWVDPERPRPEAREVALVCAEEAVRASGRENHLILDTLAEALHANGRSAEAAEVETEALQKCPEGNPSRPTYQASLERFRRAAQGGGAESSSGTAPPR